jgi:hypothetical protein
MKYIITGETTNKKRNISPEEFTKVFSKGIILNLEVFNNLGFDRKIQPNGSPINETGVAIVDGESNEDISRKLDKSPFLFKVDWTVTPFESF